MTIKAYIFMSIRAGLEEEACRKLTEFEGIKEVATIFGEYGRHRENRDKGRRTAQRPDT